MLVGREKGVQPPCETVQHDPHRRAERRVVAEDMCRSASVPGHRPIPACGGAHSAALPTMGTRQNPTKASESPHPCAAPSSVPVRASEMKAMSTVAMPSQLTAPHRLRSTSSSSSSSPSLSSP
eukprot:scaffold6748_cov122-Isochrysis_galbana.AAC.16